AGSAVHVEEDNAPGFGGLVRFPGSQRVGELAQAVGGDRLGAEEVVAEQCGQGHAGEAAAGLPDELPPSAATEVSRVVGGCHARVSSRRTGSLPVRYPGQAGSLSYGWVNPGTQTR